MKRKRFTEEQVIAVLKESEAVVSKYSIPLNSSRIENPLDDGDGRVRTDAPRATLTQCA